MLIQLIQIARSEMERRGAYFDRLERQLPGGNEHPLYQLIKECLHNAPSQRPSSEQLVSALEEMKSDIEGSYGELAKIDAVRQVMTMKALHESKVENADELIAKMRRFTNYKDSWRYDVLFNTLICINFIFTLFNIM